MREILVNAENTEPKRVGREAALPRLRCGYLLRPGGGVAALATRVPHPRNDRRSLRTARRRKSSPAPIVFSRGRRGRSDRW